jgi:GNAT superfamily N-acetyltransferase
MTRDAPARGGADPRAAIRRARRADLAGLVALWIELTEQHAAFEPLFALRAGAEDEVRRLLAAQLGDPDTAIFVLDFSDSARQGLAARPSGLQSEGRVVGFCTVRVDRAPPICVEVERAEITDVVVRKSLRRGGIGRALVEAALLWARERGIDRVEARVVSGNHEGRHFWTALGFGTFVDVLQRRL